MDKPLISVIVPIYNVEKYLPKCLDSLVGQSYPNLEIILVDDESPDRCGEICEKKKKSNKNIKVLHQKNQGVSAARNNGVKISTGEYISFVDPDDFIPLYSIAHLYSALDNTAAELAVGNSMIVFEGNRVPELRENSAGLKTACYDTEEAMRRMCYAKGFGVAPWGKLYRREMVVKNPYPVGMLHEDLALTYKIIAQCKKVVELKEIVYFYFQRKDSTMHCDIKEKHLQDGMRAANEELEFMKFNYPAVVQAATFRCCLKIIEYIPRLLDKSKQSQKYFKYLQEELKPFLLEILKDRNVSVQFKIRCISVCLGYMPARILWRTVDKVKGRAQV